MNYYFYLTLFTMGELWAIIVLFFFFFLGGGGGGGGCCVVWGICFLENNNRAQLIVFGRFGGPEKGL